MALIRKRLAVEMWIYEQLNELHGCTVRILNDNYPETVNVLHDFKSNSLAIIYLNVANFLCRMILKVMMSILI
jgi:hypothetical protein